MPDIKCNIAITCPGTDDPQANFSAEAPDVIRFGAIGWAPPGVDPVLPTVDPPPVPNGYVASGCVSVCFSSVSQEEANLCAQRQAYICSVDNGCGILDPTCGGGFTFPGTYNSSQQCIFTCADGTTFVTTIGAGTFAALNQTEADRVASNYACEVAAASTLCLDSLQASVCLDGSYSSSATVSGGVAPMAFTVEAGALPPGLTILTGTDGRTLIITGTATGFGTYAFTIKAVDAEGHTLSKNFTIQVTGIDQSTLPAGTVGVAYSETLTAASMVAPVTWAVASGSLPAGLSLNPTTGAVYGTPIAVETASFTITATGYDGVACSKALSIEIAATGVCPIADGSATPAGVAPLWTWAVYAATADVLHPNQYFTSMRTTVAYTDADTKTVLGTFALAPAALCVGEAVLSAALNKIFLLAFDTGTSLYYIYAFDVDTHAQTRSAGYVDSPNHLAYDSTNQEVAFRIKDTGTNEFRLVRFNAATLAVIATYTISVDAGNEDYYGLSYDATRDIWWTAYRSNVGPVNEIRSFNRLGGALHSSVAIADQADGSTYVPDTDRIYVASDPAHALWVYTPGLALEATVSLPISTATNYLTYAASRNELILSYQGAGPILGAVAVPANTFVCQFGTSGSAFVGVYGSNLAVTETTGQIDFWI